MTKELDAIFDALAKRLSINPESTEAIRRGSRSSTKMFMLRA